MNKYGHAHKINGCICPISDLIVKNDGTGNWDDIIRDDCPYHNAAKAAPMDHSIPWNCPTYWDGCNCRKRIKELEEKLKCHQ
jgi:hypothetical protein